MNYPVDLTKKYVEYSVSEQRALRKKIQWPRLDGMAIVGLDPNIKYLLLIESERPTLNIDEELVTQETANLIQETYKISYSKKQKEITPKIAYQKAIEEGFLVQPENFILGLQEEDQNAFTRLLTLLGLAQANDDSVVVISDKAGVLRNVTFKRLKEIMLSYGAYFQTIWATYKQSL